MRGVMIAAMAGLLAMGGAAAVQAGKADPLVELAGYYPRTWQSGDVSGAKFDVTDEVIITPVDGQSADVSFALNFFNGHTCDLQGRAVVQGRKLVFTDPDGWQGKACRLEIWRQGKDLRWSDRDNGCHSYCGMRGSFTNGKVALKLRQPLANAPKRHTD